MSNKFHPSFKDWYLRKSMYSITADKKKEKLQTGPKQKDESTKLTGYRIGFPIETYKKKTKTHSTNKNCGIINSKGPMNKSYSEISSQPTSNSKVFLSAYK